jgi:ribonuclease III
MTEADDVHGWWSNLTGWSFADRSLLERAMAHRSWCAEHSDAPSNERLEFLGDAVLGWVVADLVVSKYPDFDEGRLTDLRKALVSAEALAAMADGIGLGRWILLGAGERGAGGSQKTSILADALEALIGAVYVDAGVRRARSFVRGLVAKPMRTAVRRLGELDARSQLIRVCSREFGRPPQVETHGSGAAHEPTFSAVVIVNGERLGAGTGKSKKVALQEASAEALRVLAGRGIDIGRA